MERIEIKTTQRVEFIEITAKIQEIVDRSKVKEGICYIFTPHTTAGITINENADPSVTYDILTSLNRLFPKIGNYTHTEGNADSHIKSSIIGVSLNVFIAKGQLCLGRWQGIFFVEGDGPRRREVYVKILEG